ncbi:MAG: hypothetical protein WKG07_13825 [Hymenobacter sp.]
MLTTPSTTTWPKSRFTPRHLITRNSRLKIDFEYSDLNYSRSLYALSHYQQVGKLSLRGNFYQEADNPDAAANLELAFLDRQQLRQAGNVSRGIRAGGRLGGLQPHHGAVPPRRGPARYPHLASATYV